MSLYASAIPCNLCGYDQFGHLFDEVPASDYKFSVVQCKKCELISTRPIPDDNFLARLYSSGSYQEDTVSGKYCLGEEANRVDHQFVLRRLRSLSMGKQLLDVGCGAGMFVRTALDGGWDSYGVEPSSYASEIAKRNLGYRVHTGFLHSSAFDTISFDVITLWYVLEHVPDPMNILAHSYKLLRPGGTIFIAVPNARYILLRRRLLQVLTGTPGSVHAHEHLYHYTSRTLKAFLDKVGFEFISEHVASPYMVSGTILNSVKRLGKIAVSVVFMVTGTNLGGLLMFGRKIS